MYPTAARLVSAVCLCFLAVLVSAEVVSALPAHTDPGAFVYVNMALGLGVGWIWLGARAGQGRALAVSDGLTAAALLFALAVLVQGGNEMMRLAMLGRYSDPFEAVGAILVESLALARQGVTLRSLAMLGAGGIVTALLRDWTARRFF